MSIYDESLKFHEEKHGKIEVISRVSVRNAHDMSLAYTPRCSTTLSGNKGRPRQGLFIHSKMEHHCCNL